MKINDKFSGDTRGRSDCFKNGYNGVVDGVKAIQALNPTFFNTKTDTQYNKSMVPDLIYHKELDNVDSLHNAITHPTMFIPPPMVSDPKGHMNGMNSLTSAQEMGMEAQRNQMFNNANYYPVSNNFFSKDPLIFYSTTRYLINSMNSEKPIHLKQFDRRYAQEGNVLSTGNLLYEKNKNLNASEKKQSTVQSTISQQMSPERDVSSTKKFNIVVDGVSSQGQSPNNHITYDPQENQAQNGVRMNVLTKKAPQQKQVIYDNNPRSLMEMSPDSEMSPPQYPPNEQQYYHYNVQIGSEDQCRKNLPDKSCTEGSQSSMSHSKKNSRIKDRSSGKKRVIFEDQKNSEPPSLQKHYPQQLFQQPNQVYESSVKKSSQYASEPETLEKYPKAEVDYDHFHDKSMSRLEAVLQRQKERLENLGGFSGKSSQVSGKTNLEKVYDDLEDEINNIRRNLEESQTSEYSPMRISEPKGGQQSDKKDGMSLSPSDLDQEDHEEDAVYPPKFH